MVRPFRNIASGHKSAGDCASRRAAAYVKNRFYVHANASVVRSTQWCIAITQAAFEAIARSLPLGNVSFENKTDEQGQRLIWLDQAVVDRLRSLRGAGESYSDVILRLAKADAGTRS
jgi:hypothetical protein